ncbi:MAG: L-rhamnose isomerase [Planctomycetota bacterium]|jgi:L-rhamnose isomerase|nr:L-rhamnose isomerase [Planctomycetota bacterium]
MPKTEQVEKAFALAKEIYAEAGVDVEAALTELAKIRLSIHCWQGDDIRGFEIREGGVVAGNTVTGSYPGKATNIGEFRADVEKVLSLLPGHHRLALHAIYLDAKGKVDRDAIAPEHFQSWIDWGREKDVLLDMNQTYFDHPKANSGLTLTHPDPAIRQFWIEHGRATRRVAAAFGAAQKSPSTCNLWIQDGLKDNPADRLAFRQRLVESLDATFSDKFPANQLLDAVEPKLFGIGTETFVPGSHEFYLGYAQSRKIMLTYDNGHFHPTETIADKLSSYFLFNSQLLLHLTRGIRWDSDHILLLGEDVVDMARELVRGGFLSRTFFGTDFFDASVNRLAAWTIGVRSAQKALLIALLEPWQPMRDAENILDYTTRISLMEEAKALPWSAVWDHFCLRQNVPAGGDWLPEVKKYEREVLSRRGR